MEFGKVTPEELEHIDFTLPPDKPETTAILKRDPSPNPKIFVGCAKWGRKDWIGKIYPKGTKEIDFLNHYARHFNCIELNATFYRMPTRAQTATWKSKVTPGFKFCPKFVNTITHIRRLKNTTADVDRFMDAMSGFEDALGPVFLMPHPSFGPKNIEVLRNFIQELPKDISLFTELRQEDWYSDQNANREVFSMLEENHSGSIITDTSGRRDMVHMHLTTPEVFIRFVGNGLHPSDYTRIDAWVQRIKKWKNEGIHTVYFFMHQHEELHSPELSRYLIQELNKHCGTSIPEPKFAEDDAPQLDLDVEVKPKKEAKPKRVSAKKK
jgi:uncharacterized protein YecE (DUF72 family)